MGKCLEFGPVITEDCGHPMLAGSDSCSCVACGAVCGGQFEGCAGVWARGAVAQPLVMLTAGAAPSSNGHVAPDRRSPLIPTVSPIRNLVRSEPAPVVVVTEPAEPDQGIAAALGALCDEVRALRSEVADQRAVAADRVPRGGSEAGPSIEAIIDLVRDAVNATVDEAMVGIERSIATAVAGRMAALDAFHDWAREAVEATLTEALVGIDDLVAGAVEERMEAVETSHVVAAGAVEATVTEALEGIEQSVAAAVAERMAAIGEAQAAAVEDLRFELQDGRTMHDRALANLQQSLDSIGAAPAPAPTPAPARAPTAFAFPNAPAIVSGRNDQGSKAPPTPTAGIGHQARRVSTRRGFPPG